MLVEKAIEERKSARKFSSKMVPQDLIDKIINAGRLAPSAKNKQPWLYYQVNKEQKNQIAKELLDIYRKIDAPNSTLKATALIIEQAPILVLVFQIEYDDFYNKSYLLSMGASIENCLLQATALGVQSLWHCDSLSISDEFFANLLGVKGKLISGLCFGYCTEFEFKEKKSIEEIFKK